jgi:aarF domain-containing kinase
VCQSSAPETEFHHIQTTLEAEFKKPLELLFSSFGNEAPSVRSHRFYFRSVLVLLVCVTLLDKKPFAAASIAQVHKAVLCDSGQAVCVKIQHPQLQNQVSGDMWVFQTILNIAGHVFYDGFDFDFFAEELRQAIVKELDFITEASNCRQCGASFASRNDIRGPWRKGFLPIVVPNIFEEFTTERIITMEFIDGVHANDLPGLEKLNVRTSQVVSSLAKGIAEQIFVDGFVHCDPHPGNILLRRNTNTGEAEIVLLDHGLYWYMCTHLPVHRIFCE